MYSPLYLVKVEPGANNNKWYRLSQINDDTFKAEYGRIGVMGFQTCIYPLSQWDKKLKEKLGRGYINQTRLVAEPTVTTKKNEYADISNPSIASIVSRLQSMARQAIRDNYTISSNKVTQVMIDEAQLALNNLINTNTIDLFNNVLVELFKIIPRKMGKVRDYLAYKKDDFAKIIQREQDLLDVMKGQVIQNSVVEESDDKVEETPSQTILDALGLQFAEITNDEINLIKRNLGSVNDKYYQAWKVINNKTQEKFDKFIKINNIKENKLLWHGSRNENFWSIINTGLVLRPAAVITGKMFGMGCYFSPDSGKSLNYTSLDGSYWSKGNSNFGFMGLFDVAYGKPYNAYSFDSRFYNLDYNSLQQICLNSNCLHAHGGTGMLKKDEIVVYKEEQITIKYLVEMR